VRAQLLKTLLITALAATSVMAKVKIEKLSFKKDRNFGVVTVNYSGKMTDTPELTVKDGIVQIAMPNTVVWPKVEKQITLQKSFDSKIMAYQYNKDLARVRAVLPYSLAGKENKVSVMLEDREMKFYFPLVAPVVKKVSKAVVQAANKQSKEAYDEQYLEKLLKDKKVTKNEQVIKIENVEEVLNKNKAKEKTKTDVVSTITSATKKSADFDFSSYIFKFIGFFSLLVGGIYVLMNFFRKGMLKKGGLGFLSGTKVVEVLNTTYLAPKRSLLVVRVNKQVFLLSQSEKGMDFLTEIKDTAAFMKEGEKEVIGSNFDTNLESANTEEKEFKLKDMTSTMEEKEDATSLVKAITGQEEKVSLSSQIKNKIKDLKPLQ
jgi:flagellar biogenesis protein FliO